MQLGIELRMIAILHFFQQQKMGCSKIGMLICHVFQFINGYRMQGWLMKKLLNDIVEW